MCGFLIRVPRQIAAARPIRHVVQRVLPHGGFPGAGLPRQSGRARSTMPRFESRDRSARSRGRRPSDDRPREDLGAPTAFVGEAATLADERNSAERRRLDVTARGSSQEDRGNHHMPRRPNSDPRDVLHSGGQRRRAVKSAPAGRRLMPIPRARFVAPGEKLPCRRIHPGKRCDSERLP